MCFLEHQPSPSDLCRGLMTDYGLYAGTKEASQNLGDTEVLTVTWGCPPEAVRPWTLIPQYFLCCHKVKLFSCSHYIFNVEFGGML